ncbi:hypothetical protein NBRC110019_18780 [Neptunitalea chrysea]|uniref:Energy transducer TonB n=2 Tax=Neptunitalea chrysea TaxID=1647581 RepID=A0A9W6EWE5_9FLAO|nr:hypothetical protein NBRC110019_18780 [Neptunitalea chrysea]
MFYTGMTRFDPPIENGIAVNLGYTDTGGGDVQPLEKIKSEPVVAQQPSSPVPEEVEEVLTSEEEDVPVVPTTEKTQETKEDTPPVKEPVKAQPQQPAKDAASALAAIEGAEEVDGTVAGGEGPGDGPGDKGQENGDPYAASYYGGPGNGTGGRGWGLGGRGTPTFKKVKQNCNESGTVVVKIVVNRSGEVVEAEPGIKGTINKAPCLLEPAKQIAESYKWPKDDEAPARQIGYVVVKFGLGE